MATHDDKTTKKEKQDRKDEKLDEVLDDSFPASDPPSRTGVTGDGEGPEPKTDGKG